MPVSSLARPSAQVKASDTGDYRHAKQSEVVHKIKFYQSRENPAQA
jgi:hypothetical protein